MHDDEDALSVPVLRSRQCLRRVIGRLGSRIALVMVAAACEPATTIAIGSPTSDGTITFTLFRGDTSRPAPISAFRIDRCQARGSPAPESHWLTMAPDTAEPIARIRYGVPPVGWRSVQGPQIMVPGCYRAAVANSPPLEFDLLADGHAKARR